ncbi:hypothetical protein [Listeria seeligeri]|uniref:hypothetical protein n=1 Tax=Listeria seeligeri TaxID=1640 RepID=UPI001625B905|nr:hypothetical protein [Listeria seeligeri]MBC1832273.1 hypothetical protein [Listeria seeligeri]MBC1851190.1 hypothetical protein [Listeria seeligeri]MBC1929328.1 hypothetical protein [Listeria seeligeri]MBF2370284.1 hypothetical protein [Listeria seeligeri]MBF2390484.1 hypothetical protein [Listeria seeligeri]
MNAKNKKKRMGLIQQLCVAEDNEDIAEITRIGTKLMRLEDPEEIDEFHDNTRHRVELTVNEYLEYREIFTDQEIAGICGVHEKTLYLFRKRNGLVIPRKEQIGK